MKKDMKPFISIVTLNYNQSEVTCAFLESTKKLVYRHFEILVCDMASRTDPSDLILSNNYPNTRLLLSDVNLGFAAGNNWGIKQAKGDLILIVNNDTEVTPHLLDYLAEPFYQDSSIGVTCPKIKYFDRPSIIEYAGFNRMNMYTGRTSGIGANEEDKGQYDISRKTFGAHGCAMMVKREVIERVGMFPEKFFLYYEEWDWSARIMEAEYTIWYAAKAEIFHKQSVTVGKNNPLKVYYQTRNRILFMRRNSSMGQLALFTSFFIFFTIPRALITYFAKREFKSLKYFLKGVIWNLYSSSKSSVR